METNVEDIANAVRDLSIAGDVPQDHGRKPLNSERNHLFLQDIFQTLDLATNTITSQAQNIKSVVDNASSSAGLPMTGVCFLHESVKKLTVLTTHLDTIIDTLNEATERSVIRHLKSLGNQKAAIRSKKTTQQFFSHFDTKIRSIIREVLKSTSDQSMLWKVAEECYKQATGPSGTLDADDYFIPLEEAQLEWPYDPDFESEEYYEHEDRINLDEDYATAFQAQTERRDQARTEERQSWPDFWARVLSNSPDGPTLFYPPASRKNQSLRFDAIPQYLFRTFDADSSGKNDENVIASTASVFGPHERSRIDLLALHEDKAAHLLHKHLTKGCFSGECSDNLMSWTSSLLFAIQYAVWRLQCRGRHSSDIKICAVDTGRFPRGQFARDTWLLEAYKLNANQDDPAQDFFRFRLEDERFYNGEYLSQGAVNHAYRSCVVSLESLIQAGLFQLYPKFEDVQGSKKWAYRALDLRQIWSEEQRTTDLEIKLALKVAGNCFSRFEACDIASILLAFKNRRYSKLNTTNAPNRSSKQPPGWADKPDEVRRYWIASEAVNSHNKLRPEYQFEQSICSTGILQPRQILREIFD